ncbi:hypothetical protein [Sphingomonas sp. T9W2]|uniref:hypothetical protein n=1 Tax=Sphingomonas sp. T9W2 TaxID=3143183 RepID=UPI0031F55682
MSGAYTSGTGPRWDPRYRRLRAGETILATDECQRDDGSWVPAVCVGWSAPDPNYTSHRVYRRLSADAAVTVERTLAAGRIIDIMTGGKFDWRSRLGDSDFLESADWMTALAYADAARAPEPAGIDYESSLFDVLETLKAHYPSIAGGFARGTGGFDRDYILDELRKPASAPAGKLDRGRTARRIKELMDEGDGFWRACSGCQEGVDGYVSERDYPFDPVFRCQPGGGCSECGGIGVLWDDGRGYGDITGDEKPASASAEDQEPDPFDDCLGVHVEANARRHGLGYPRGAEVDRECQAVWRSAMADAVGALDVLKGKWLHSRRKNEREAGAVLGAVLDALWSAREPAARSYREAFENGKALIDRIPAIVDRPPQ